MGKTLETNAAERSLPGGSEQNAVHGSESRERHENRNKESPAAIETIRKRLQEGFGSVILGLNYLNKSDSRAIFGNLTDSTGVTIGSKGFGGVEKLLHESFIGVLQRI